MFSALSAGAESLDAGGLTSSPSSLGDGSEFTPSPDCRIGAAVLLRLLRLFFELRSGGARIGIALVGRLCGKMGRGGPCVCGA